MDRDAWKVDGGPEGLPPLAVRQALAAVLAGRLPLAADAVLAGTLGAEQLYALEEGVRRLTHDGHGPDVIAELERRLVGLASARGDVDLAGPAAEYRAGLGADVGEQGRVDPEDPSSDGRASGPVVGAAAPARGAEPPDRAARGPGAPRRRPGRGARDGRRISPPWGRRVTARGPPRPGGSACARSARAPVRRSRPP